MTPFKTDYDFIIIGSGFGGSVSALRLSEKGYKVLVIEKGKRYTAKDFPKTNWDIKRFFWVPLLKFFGICKLTFFKHVGILSGVGVGGGSLVYGNTLQVPPTRFFEAESWGHLAPWEKELAPHYEMAKKMLGVVPNPQLGTADLALGELAKRIGRENTFSPTNVAAYFGQPGVVVKDPYFGGKGPDRAGCTFCGGCMLGCRHNAKNSLDRNYLYLAEGLGATVLAESEVVDVVPLGNQSPEQNIYQNGQNGYEVTYKTSTKYFSEKKKLTTKGIIFSGGVLGTISLLLKLKQKKSLPQLSEQLGCGVRTNSESLIGVTTLDSKKTLSDGVAIGSILHTDENSFLEPTRYSSGSGFWRLLTAPLVTGNTMTRRLFEMTKDWIKHPIKNFKVTFVNDWSKRTAILLFMQTINSTLRFSNSFWGMKSELSSGEAPSAFIPQANSLAHQYAEIVTGKPAVLMTESLLGIPTTAHILGGACMGADAREGVIDKDHKVFGYENMWVCDGSTISANPGVNPSLTITALTERAMSLIPSAPRQNLS